MTAKQLTILKTGQRQYLTTDQFPPGYSGMTRLLTRMHQTLLVEGKKKVPLIQKSPIQTLKNVPEFYHLPHVGAPGLQNYQHEYLAAQFYVAYYTTGFLQQWYWEPHEEYLRFKLVPDRPSVIKDKILFWEIDRGTENLSDLEKKVPKYIELSQVKQKKFHVAIAVPTKGRARNVLVDILPKHKRANQFLVTTHDLALNDPLGKVFASPLDPSRFLSLDEL